MVGYFLTGFKGLGGAGRVGCASFRANATIFFLVSLSIIVQPFKDGRACVTDYDAAVKLRGLLPAACGESE